MLKLDHIAVAGETLEAAQAHVEGALGVPLQEGGQHARFSTHNALLGLADGLYLEAIAVDPAQTPEHTPRWFDLDRFTGQPRLTNWICSSEDLARTLENLPQAGHIHALSRGALQWQMAVPETGVLPFDNLCPALLQWDCPHPAAALTQQGCSLQLLIVCHPEAKALAQLCGPVKGPVVFETGAPQLIAEIQTPHGLRLLQ